MVLQSNRDKQSECSAGVFNMFNTKFELPSFRNLQLLIGLLWFAIAGHFVAIQWLNPLTSTQLLATATNYPTRIYAMIAGGLGIALMLIASLDLLTQKERGPKLFLIGMVFILIHDLLLGPQFNLIWLERFDHAIYILMGIITTLIWSKPLNSLFSKKSFDFATFKNIKTIFCTLIALNFLCITSFYLGEKTWLISNYASLINWKALSSLLIATFTFLSTLFGALIFATQTKAIVTFIFRYNIAKLLLPLSVISDLLRIGKAKIMYIYGWPYFLVNLAEILIYVMLTMVFIKAFDKDFIASLATDKKPFPSNVINTEQITSTRNTITTENSTNTRNVISNEKITRSEKSLIQIQK